MFKSAATQIMVDFVATKLRLDTFRKVTRPQLTATSSKY